MVTFVCLGQRERHADWKNERFRPIQTRSCSQVAGIENTIGRKKAQKGGFTVGLTLTYQNLKIFRGDLKKYTKPPEGGTPNPNVPSFEDAPPSFSGVSAEVILLRVTHWPLGHR
jgi:hypothetical protein